METSRGRGAGPADPHGGFDRHRRPRASAAAEEGGWSAARFIADATARAREVALVPPQDGVTRRGAAVCCLAAAVKGWWEGLGLQTDWQGLVDAFLMDQRRVLTAETAAGLVHLHQSRFLEEFKRRLGITWGRFKRGWRMLKCRRDCDDHPEIRLKDIAKWNGFAGPSTLSRSHATFFGWSPRGAGPGRAIRRAASWLLDLVAGDAARRAVRKGGSEEMQRSGAGGLAGATSNLSTATNKDDPARRGPGERGWKSP